MHELSLKPDLAEAAKRWEAFYAGEMIDRPIITITAPRDGYTVLGTGRRAQGLTYHDKVFGDLDDIIDRAMAASEDIWWGGESIPSFGPSMGPDEVAVWAGAELKWSDESPNTNWSAPCVERWEDVLPLQIADDNPLWTRILALYERAAERMAGKMLLTPPDLHSNMDLLAALRGPERLCMDLIDQPEMIDEAMKSSRALFPKIWESTVAAGKMRERGFYNHVYSPDGAAMLQCDFICMMSPPMFRRWVLPALEEEAATVGHVFFHWDGPGALAHTDDVIASQGLELLAYVPGAGNKPHAEHAGLYRSWQDRGKAVFASGTPDQLKTMHRILDPARVVYQTSVQSQAEGEALLEWFVQNS